MSEQRRPCASCYGSGEVVTEHGAVTCPDCFGDGESLGRGAKVEWRLRALAEHYATVGGEVGGDVQWLIHEVRRGREALLGILTRCQDADERDELARDVKYRANETLGIYEEEKPSR